MVPTKDFPGGLGRQGGDRWDLTKGMTKRFPVTTLKCETMVLSMHRKGVINGARMGYGMVPEEIHKGISTPSMWNSVPLARNKMIKNLLKFAPFIIIVCKTWPRGVTQSSCYKMRSLSAVSRRWCYSARWLTCWNLKLLGWRIPLQALPDVACVAPQAQRDELILELFWTCIKLRGFDPMSHGNKKQDYQKSCGW